MNTPVKQLRVGDRVLYRGCVPATVTHMENLLTDDKYGVEIESTPWDMRANVVVDLETDAGKNHWAYAVALLPMPEEETNAIPE